LTLRVAETDLLEIADLVREQLGHRAESLGVRSSVRPAADGRADEGVTAEVDAVQLLILLRGLAEHAMGRLSQGDSIDFEIGAASSGLIDIRIVCRAANPRGPSLLGAGLPEALAGAAEILDGVLSLTSAHPIEETIVVTLPVRSAALALEAPEFETTG